MTVNKYEEEYGEHPAPSAPVMEPTLIYDTPHVDDNNDMNRDLAGGDGAVQDDRSNRKVVNGAAVAGGLAGLLVGGPIGAAIGAGTWGYVAKHNDQELGQAARHSGHTMIKVGQKMQGSWQQHRNVARHHPVTQQTQRGWQNTSRRVQQWDEQHHVSCQTAQAITKGCDWVNRRLDGDGSIKKEARPNTDVHMMRSQSNTSRGRREDDATRLT